MQVSNRFKVAIAGGAWTVFLGWMAGWDFNRGEGMMWLVAATAVFMILMTFSMEEGK